MLPPHKVAARAAAGQFWSLTARPRGEQMEVKHFRTRVVGESFYQEARISPRNLSPAEGVHEVGSLVLGCEEESRTIHVRVEVAGERDGRRTPADFPPVRLVEPTRRFNNSNVADSKLYVTDWCHLDAIAIDVNETLFIRSPAHVSGWMSAFWGLRIEQCPLPEEVVRHPSLRDVIGEVDIQNPWFQSSHPMQLANTFVFQALGVQQPHAKAILQAIADVYGNEDAFPLATLTFSNQRHPRARRLQTPIGTLDTRYIIERTLGLCASLKPYQRPEVMLLNPPNKEEVSLRGNEVLVVKLAPMPDGNIPATNLPWFLGPHPSFLHFEGQASEGKDDVFRFRVRSDYPDPKNDWIRFINGNREMTVLAKYEK